MFTIEPSVEFVIKQESFRSAKYGKLNVQIVGYYNDKSFTIKVSDIITRTEMVQLYISLISKGHILVDSELDDFSFVHKYDHNNELYSTEQSFKWSC